MDFLFVETIWLSIKLAVLTTAFLLVISVPISYFLVYSKIRFKSILHALISMPLVLPPSVLGFYLLIAFSPTNWLGEMMARYFNLHLAFSFAGILIGSIIYNLPFMVNALYNGLVSLPNSLRQASYTLGKSAMTTLFKVLLPNIKSAILTGICLTFAHTLGEFGIILMIGGNIQGQTRVASIAVYDEVQALNFEAANRYALFLFGLSFIILVMVHSINKNNSTWKNF